MLPGGNAVIAGIYKAHASLLHLTTEGLDVYAGPDSPLSYHSVIPSTSVALLLKYNGVISESKPLFICMKRLPMYMSRWGHPYNSQFM